MSSSSPQEKFYALRWASFYALALSLMIMSYHANPIILYLFVVGDKYSLGGYGIYWQDWHAIGCAFAGLVSYGAAYDTDFGPAARRWVSLCNTFLFGIWGLQNTYYCLFQADDFTPLMRLQAIGCLGTALWSYVSIESKSGIGAGAKKGS
mmetsp:Transcript_15450/g.29223  ORF Transcript_15450/g.29223 Transcript_15450/m.29223 type:complete len:150 (+) Transcript_15450:256-705(+)|eukprot:scaffold2357_cov167-Amphora_coffeaeformis.AAC.7